MTRLFQKPTRLSDCAEKHDSRKLKVALLFMAAIASLFVLAAFTLEKPQPRHQAALLPLPALFSGSSVECRPARVRARRHCVVGGAAGLQNLHWVSRPRALAKQRDFKPGIRLTCAPFDGGPGPGCTSLLPPPLPAPNRGCVHCRSPDERGSWWQRPIRLPALVAHSFALGHCRFSSNALCWRSAYSPWRHRGPQGVFASDGLTLFTLPFVSERALKNVTRLASIEGLASVKNKDFPAAIEWAERGLRDTPEQSDVATFWEWANWASISSISLGPCLRRALLAPKPIWRTRPFFCFISPRPVQPRQPPRLEMLDRASREASTLTPWAPTIQATRGADVIESGDSTRGLPCSRKL